MAQVAPGDRAYIKSDELFGEVTRTHILGLENSPVILRDDGRYVAFVGEKTSLVVNKETASDGVGTFTTPLDVRLVGIELLTAHGVPQETQALMFTNFVTKLSKAQRAGYTAQFDSVDASQPDQLKGFLDAMVAALTAL